MKRGFGIPLVLLALVAVLPFTGGTAGQDAPEAPVQRVSDHFDGTLYFNPPGIESPSHPPAPGGLFSRYRWLWRWVFSRSAWPTLPEHEAASTGPPPPSRVPAGALRVTPVGHATFLIQMDGFNILTDPIWSERCSPVSWAGPRRYKEPGIRFEDLPPIDAVLISHNHYDHLDLPTLERLARKGAPRAVTPLGNRELIRESAIPRVEELDWWESVQLSPAVTVTLVPARHFSARTPWDRNRTLWGGFVISGPSGNVFHAGDTGYGRHFQEIGSRFSPIRVALLPISPFRPRRSQDPPTSSYSAVHIGPAEAVQAHLDLGAETSIAGHYQVFQLGTDGFADAVNELASTVKARDLPPGSFLVQTPGQAVEIDTGIAEIPGPEEPALSAASHGGDSRLAGREPYRIGALTQRHTAAVVPGGGFEKRFVYR